jgi:TPR repeat protein
VLTYIRSFCLVVTIGLLIAYSCDAQTPQKPPPQVVNQPEVHPVTTSHFLPTEGGKATLVQLWLLAQDGNDRDAQFYLGLIYATGKGVPKDATQAVGWYRKAADQGLAEAQFFLGLMYRDGEGISQDSAQAAAWYRKAAEQGNAYGQYNLGYLHANGWVVSNPDAGTFVTWFWKAAQQGYAPAQAMLGAMYAKGDGVSKDLVAAYMWSSLSAAQGDETGKTNRDLLESRMSNEQIAEAQKLSREWRPTK